MQRVFIEFDNAQVTATALVVALEVPLGLAFTILNNDYGMYVSVFTGSNVLLNGL